jgi:serine/threonine-protein kinase
MDWGLARRVRSPGGAVPVQQPSGPAGTPGPREGAPLLTQAGTVMGTPLYMSPEQARGDHDALDTRSDVYSLCVVFHEFLYLHHYLDGRESLNDILQGVQTVLPAAHKLLSSPHQPPVPAELAWFVSQGFAKDPAKRHASVDAMIEALKGMSEGRIEVQCQRTLIKRGLHEVLRFVDRHPVGTIVGSTLGALLVLASVVHLLVSLFR